MTEGAVGEVSGHLLDRVRARRFRRAARAAIAGRDEKGRDSREDVGKLTGDSDDGGAVIGREARMPEGNAARKDII